MTIHFVFGNPLGSNQFGFNIYSKIYQADELLTTLKNSAKITSKSKMKQYRLMRQKKQRLFQTAEEYIEYINRKKKHKRAKHKQKRREENEGE